ncbi:glycosyltransferase [Akkermansiaceae bacterium]|nr:glycosyltransferase [Akkermansiaceae bacterium]
MSAANKKKKKIMLHIIMPDQISGPNNSTELIANSFLKEKYEFGFLAQTFHSGSKINWSLIKDLSIQIKNFNPDLIHLSGLQGSCFHAVIAARIIGRKNILVAVRGSSVDSIKLSRTMKFIFGKVIEPITMKLSKKIYTVCEAMGRRNYIILNAGHRFLGTIHNSAPNINMNEIVFFGLRKKLNISHDSVIVVIVGRIIYDKGITFVADAIKEINDKKIKFIFVGEETDKMNLPELLSDQVKDKKVFFMGNQANVISILNECDIFLFATLHENLSNALLEASSVGLAIIATDVGGNPEVIKNKFNGLLIPPANSEIIKEKLLFLANDKKIRTELGRNAKRRVEESFSQKVLLKKLEGIYDRMLS